MMDVVSGRNAVIARSFPRTDYLSDPLPIQLMDNDDRHCVDAANPVFLVVVAMVAAVAAVKEHLQLGIVTSDHRMNYVDQF